MRLLFLIAIISLPFCSNRPGTGAGFGADFNLVLSSTVSTAEVGSQNVAVKAEQKFKNGSVVDVTASVTFSVSDSTVLDVVGGVIQAKKIGVAQITAIQGGVSSNALAITVLDTVGPSLTAAVTQDLNQDGVIDAVRLTFSEPVRDSTLNEASIQISGIAKNPFSSTTAGDVADNNVLYFTFPANPSNHTGVTLRITFGFVPIKDLNGYAYDGVAAMNTADGARPIVKSVAATQGFNHLSVVFSEPVYSSTVGCPGATLATSAFSYTNGNAAGAASLTGISHGCSDAFVQLTLNSNAILGTTCATDGDCADTLASVAGQIMDKAGNEVIPFTNNVTVSASGGYFRRLYASGNVASNGKAVRIVSGSEAGNWWLVHGGSNQTSIYDENTGHFRAVATNLTATVAAGSFVTRMQTGANAGKWLVVHGGGLSSTSWFDETTCGIDAQLRATCTVSAGPSISTGSVNAGGYAIRIGSGPNQDKHLIFHGTTTATSYYEEATGNFMAGPTLAAAPTSDAHAFKLVSGPNSGKWFIILGGSTSTHYYNETTGLLEAGPALPVAAGGGSRAFLIQTGANAGQWLIVTSGTTTRYFDGSTYTAAPALFRTMNTRGFHFRVSSGPHANKWLLITSQGSPLSSWFDETTSTTSDGPTFVTMNDTIGFTPTKGPDKGRTLFTKGGTTPEIHHFRESDGSTAAYSIFTAGVGNGGHSYYIDSGAHAGKWRIVYGAGQSSSTLFNPTTAAFETAPSFPATLGNGGQTAKIQSGNQNGKWMSIHGASAQAYFYNGGTLMGDHASTGATTQAGLSTDSFSIFNANKWLFVHCSSTGTTLFDEANDTVMSAGPVISANAGSGCTSLYNSVTSRWVIVHGSGALTTSLYTGNPVDTITAGPVLSGVAGTGAHAFKLTSGANAGKWLVIHANGGTGTSFYDETLNSFAAGPAATSGVNLGGSAFKITAGQHAGKWLVYNGNPGTADNTMLFSEAASSFAVGPKLPNGGANGAHSFLINTGSFNGYQFFINGNGSHWSLYVP